MSFSNVFMTEPYPDQKLTHGTLSGSTLTPKTSADNTTPQAVTDVRLFRRKSGQNTAFVNVYLKGVADDSVKVQVFGIDPLLGNYILLGERTVTIPSGGQAGVSSQGSEALSCKTSGMDWFVYLAAYNITVGSGNGVAISAFSGVQS